MRPSELIREYLKLGLRFDRIENGYVDARSPGIHCCAEVADEPSPQPAELALQAQRLLAALADVPRRDGFTRCPR